MKRYFSIAAGLVLSSGLALAQKGPGPGPSTNDNNVNHSWSNNVSLSNAFNYSWGTNSLARTNVPKEWSKQTARSYAGQAAAGGGGQVQSRFGKKTLPTDVQSVVDQFQQDRTKLMNQLKACSDEQRQLILNDLVQMRTQLRNQIGKIREDARQQAEQMRNRLGNNRDAILNQGGTSTGTGRDRDR